MIREIEVLKEPHDTTGIYKRLISPKEDIKMLELQFNLHPKTREEALKNRKIYQAIEKIKSIHNYI